jgi:hypothetical protein
MRYYAETFPGGGKKWRISNRLPRREISYARFPVVLQGELVSTEITETLTIFSIWFSTLRPFKGDFVSSECF